MQPGKQHQADAADKEHKRTGGYYFVDGKPFVPGKTAKMQGEPRQEYGPDARSILHLEPAPRACPQKGKGDAGKCAEDALRVPTGVVFPEVAAHEHLVQPTLQIVFIVERRKSKARHRDARPQQPVTDENARDGRGQPVPAQMQMQPERRQIHHGDALQNAGNPQRVQMEKREAVHEKAETEQERRPLQGPGPDPVRFGPDSIPGRRQGHRDADEEKEYRKDEIHDRPAVPARMDQGAVHVHRVAGVVGDDHEAHGHAAQEVNGEKPTRVFHGNVGEGVACWARCFPASVSRCREGFTRRPVYPAYSVRTSSWPVTTRRIMASG